MNIQASLSTCLFHSLIFPPKSVMPVFCTKQTAQDTKELHANVVFCFLPDCFLLVPPNLFDNVPEGCINAFHRECSYDKEELRKEPCASRDIITTTE